MSDRYISPFPLPTPQEREHLDILIEECSEVIQRATKLLRFGAKEIQPGQPLTNSERLSLEIGDLNTMIDECKELGLVHPEYVLEGEVRKQDQLKKFLQVQP